MKQKRIPNENRRKQQKHLVFTDNNNRRSAPHTIALRVLIYIYTLSCVAD